MLVDLQGEGALNERVYRSLRQSILAGRLARGVRLPSTRALAADLGVSRKAIALAFMRLGDEGYVEGRVGSGTFVAATIPDAGPPPSNRKRAAPTEPPRLRLSSYGRRVLAQRPWPPPGARPAEALPFDFHYGSPAFTDFPHATWSRLVARRARTISMTSLRYGRALGFAPLREAIAGYLSRVRGVVATADQVIVVNGSQQALDLIVRLFVDPGDRVVFEEPGYHGARHILAAAGARLMPAAVDEQGLDVSRLPVGRNVRFAYVTPSHQFPLGGVLPLARRLRLLRWAAEEGTYVVEDDYDSEFRYEGHPIEAVQGLDRAGRVVYIGTFSKVLFPGLRLAYLVLPPQLITPIASLKFLTDLHTSTFAQAVLADFIGGGHFERHLRRTRTRNAARRRALLEAAQRELGDRVEIHGANAGLHVVMWLKGVHASRMDELRLRAAAAGVGVYSVAMCYMRPPRLAGLLVGYASLTEREIDDGIVALARVLRGFV
jgi:GntR family transcriptional regulator / MocR family aminotransferase